MKSPAFRQRRRNQEGEKIDLTIHFRCGDIFKASPSYGFLGGKYYKSALDFFFKYNNFTKLKHININFVTNFPKPLEKSQRYRDAIFNSVCQVLTDKMKIYLHEIIQKFFKQNIQITNTLYTFSLFMQ